jgi:hypothetical protein
MDPDLGAISQRRLRGGAPDGLSRRARGVHPTVRPGAGHGSLRRWVCRKPISVNSLRQPRSIRGVNRRGDRVAPTDYRYRQLPERGGERGVAGRDLVWPGFVIVVEELLEDGGKVVLAEDQEVVEQLPTNVPTQRSA